MRGVWAGLRLRANGGGDEDVDGTADRLHHRQHRRAEVLDLTRRRKGTEGIGVLVGVLTGWRQLTSTGS
jgi:hypothetical protein